MVFRRLLYVFACFHLILGQPVRIICIPSQIVPHDSFLITLWHHLPSNHSSAQICVKGVINHNHTVISPKCVSVHHQKGCPRLDVTLFNKTSISSLQWVVSYQLLPGRQKMYQYTDKKWISKIGASFLYDYPCEDCVFSNHEI